MIILPQNSNILEMTRAPVVIQVKTQSNLSHKIYFNARDAEKYILIDKIQLPPKWPRKTWPHFQFSILTTVPPVPNTVDVLLVL